MDEMNAAVKVEEVSPVKRKISIEVPWVDVKKERDTVYRNFSRTAKIKGFRQGKVPRKILELHYKKQVEEETVSHLVNRLYFDALKEHDIRAVSQPEIEEKGIEEEKDFAFTATVEVEPKIDPQGYLGLPLDKKELTVTEDEVTGRLEEIRKMFGTLEEVTEEREIKAGDFVTIDYEGSVDGNKPEEMTRENYFLEIGSKTMIPGFEDQLIGEKVGSTKEIHVKFPDEYQVKEVAGKDAVFTVSIKNLKEKKLPELDENFVKNFDQYESLDALKADVRKSLVEERQKQIEEELSKQIVDKLLEQNAFEVPSFFVEQQVYYMLLEAQKRLITSGMDPQMITQLSGTWRDRYREDAIRIVKSSLLLKSIADKEGINVTNEDLENRFKEIAARYSQDYEQIRDSFDENMKENIRNEVLSRKVFDFIESKADVTLVGKEESPAEEAK